MDKKNPIGWFEIFVNDIYEAEKFYKEIFNWEFKLSINEGKEYWLIKTGNKSIGGGLIQKERKEEASGDNIRIYIEVSDINKILRKVKELGGKEIKTKTLIAENSGYYGLFADKDGNIVGLWSQE